jgi:hypothetical protein
MCHVLYSVFPGATSAMTDQSSASENESTTLEELSAAIRTLSTDTRSIGYRLELLELEGRRGPPRWNSSGLFGQAQTDDNVADHAPIQDSQRGQSLSFGRTTRQTDVPGPTACGAAGNTHLHVQAQYQTIKDSIQNVKLPTDLMVFDNKSGLRREDQQLAGVVSKCARYGETALKLL